MESALAASTPTRLPDSRRARWRLHHPLLVQVAHYVVVGGLATVANAVVFLLLRTGLDTVPANIVALLVSTAVSTEANHRFTFGGGAVRRWRARVQIGGTVLFYAFYSSAVLLLLETFLEDPAPVQESLAVAVASVLAGIVRFFVLRYWVFGTDERRTWQGGRMGRTSLTRTAAAILAGAALFLSSAGACGPAGGDDDAEDAPGVTQQDDDGPDDDGDDD